MANMSAAVAMASTREAGHPMLSNDLAFDRCYARFRSAAAVDLSGTDSGSAVFSQIEARRYMLGFLSVVRQTLLDADYRLFRLHYLLGADLDLCGCDEYHMERIRARLSAAFSAGGLDRR